MNNIQNSAGRKQLLSYTLNKNSTAKKSVKPDFTKFDCCTKTAATMSEDSYKKNILTQAQQDAKNGVFQESESFKMLKKGYVSVVSPDRRTLIEQLLNSILGEKTKNIGYTEVYDESGQLVATYSGKHGWHMIATSQEQARESTFNAIYNEAYTKAIEAQGNTSNVESTNSLNVTI